MNLGALKDDDTEVEWDDITDIVSSFAKTLKTGEYVTKDGYGLPQAMACQSTSEAKTDLAAFGIVPLSVVDAWSLRGLPRVLSRIEILDAMNTILCNFTSWLAGQTVAETLCRCLFLHRPEETRQCSMELACFSGFVLRTVMLIRSAICRADLHFEEDFNVSPCGLDINYIGGMVNVDGFPTHAALNKKSRDYEHKLSRSESVVDNAIAKRLALFRHIHSVHLLLSKCAPLSLKDEEEALIKNKIDGAVEHTLSFLHCHLHLTADDPSQPVPENTNEIPTFLPSFPPKTSLTASQLREKIVAHRESKAKWSGGTDLDTCLLLSTGTPVQMIFSACKFDYQSNLPDATLHGDCNCECCLCLSSALIRLKAHLCHCKALVEIRHVHSIEHALVFVKHFSSDLTNEVALSSSSSSYSGKVADNEKSVYETALRRSSEFLASPPDFVCFANLFNLIPKKKMLQSMISKSLAIFCPVPLEKYCGAPVFVSILLKMENLFLRNVRQYLSNRGRSRRLCSKMIRKIGELQLEIDYVYPRFLEDKARMKKEVDDMDVDTANGQQQWNFEGDDNKPSPAEPAAAAAASTFGPEPFTEMEIEKVCRSMALWLVGVCMSTMKRYVLLGFDLELYEKSEMMGMWWYLDIIANIEKSLIAEKMILCKENLMTSEFEEMSLLHSSSSHKHHGNNSSNAATAFWIKLHESDETNCMIEKLIFKGFVLIFLLLSSENEMNSNLLSDFAPMRFDAPHGSAESRFNFRIEPFHQVSHPPVYDFEAFADHVKTHLKKAQDDPIQMIQLVNECFLRARKQMAEYKSMRASTLKYFKSLKNAKVGPSCEMFCGDDFGSRSSPSCNVTQRICIANGLVTSLMKRSLGNGNGNGSNENKDKKIAKNFGMSNEKCIVLDWGSASSLPILRVCKKADNGGG